MLSAHNSMEYNAEKMLGTRTRSEKTPKRSQNCFGFVQGYFHDLSASQIQPVFHLKDLKKKPKSCLLLSIYIVLHVIAAQTAEA